MVLHSQLIQRVRALKNQQLSVNWIFSSSCRLKILTFSPSISICFLHRYLSFCPVKFPEDQKQLASIHKINQRFVIIPEHSVLLLYLFTLVKKCNISSVLPHQWSVLMQLLPTIFHANEAKYVIAILLLKYHQSCQVSRLIHRIKFINGLIILNIFFENKMHYRK